MVSRVQVAHYLADHLESERGMAIAAVAAWLVSRGKRRQADYLARDVATVLASRGYITGRITTARPLSRAARERIESFIRSQTGAGTLEVSAVVRREVIGGALIELPGQELDATVKSKMGRFVEGVTR